MLFKLKLPLRYIAKENPWEPAFGQVPKPRWEHYSELPFLVSLLFFLSPIPISYPDPSASLGPKGLFWKII